jgi:hypothetical protein
MIGVQVTMSDMVSTLRGNADQPMADGIFKNVNSVILLCAAVQKSQPRLPVFRCWLLSFSAIAMTGSQKQVVVVLEWIRFLSRIKVIDLHALVAASPQSMLHGIGASLLKIPH